LVNVLLEFVYILLLEKEAKPEPVISFYLVILTVCVPSGWWINVAVNTL